MDVFLLLLFYLPHHNRARITNDLGYVEKRSGETVRAYERLVLLELRARVIYINWTKDGVKSKMERFKIGFHIYLII